MVEYFCGQCGKFKYKRNLVTHEKGHKGSLSFSACGKGLPSRIGKIGNTFFLELIINQLPVAYTLGIELCISFARHFVSKKNWAIEIT